MIENETLNGYLNEALKFFENSHLTFPKMATVNIYHHRGIKFIYETGALFINVINREYCKNFVVMLPGQIYPDHYHIQKTESCYILHGDFSINLDGKNHTLSNGELINIEQKMRHSFGTKTGVVFEEISTTYVPNDSIYTDEKIRNASYDERRTTLNSEDWSEIISKWKK